MKLKINLATRTYLNTRQVDLSLALAVLLLGGWLLAQIVSAASLAGEQSRFREQIRDLQQKARAEGREVDEKEYKALLARVKFANQIIEKKSRDWLSLLGQLEAVVPDGIAITGITPDTKEPGLIKIAGAGANFNQVRRFIENLENAPYFSDIYLVSQAELRISDKQRGVSFTVTCKAAHR